MSSVIYLADERPAAVTPPPEGEPLLDRRARPLRDLRISVTDRCNFRCTYCMPREVFDANYRFMPHSALLSFEEITRAARIFVRLGTEKIRLTGGEPLLRKDIDKLIAMLAGLRTPQGRPLDLTLTTNASLLARKARALKAAGLARVTVSLDALDPARFARLADADYTPGDVLAGIDAAAEAGLPVKVNMVVRRGVNDAEILPWRAASGIAAMCCASSSTWMWATATAGMSPRCCPATSCWRACASTSRSSPSTMRPWGGSPSAGAMPTGPAKSA